MNDILIPFSIVPDFILLFIYKGAHRIFWWQSRLNKIPDNSEEKECLINNTSDSLPE